MRVIDLTPGQRFGKLVVLARAENTKRGHACWKVVCDCGQSKIVRAASLGAGSTRACGCLNHRITDLTGRRFERLVVVERVESTKRGQARWSCVCDCGTTSHVVRGSHLTQNLVKSCRCLLGGRTHGQSGNHYQGRKASPEYVVWNAMKRRSLNPNEPRYSSYGGANPPVTICDRWKESFENFLADLGERPAGTTLGPFRGCREL